jgi:ABC-type branched-subunit amino acid transport system permease subunit
VLDPRTSRLYSALMSHGGNWWTVWRANRDGELRCVAGGAFETAYRTAATMAGSRLVGPDGTIFHVYRA